jgi:pyroglutamyl-peptidase
MARSICITLLLAGAWAGVTCAEEKPAAKEKTDKLPVILLTGFEPFGAGRPPNPSWEGVKRLDGQQWQGYRLVAKQLPVVWGEPLPLLGKWIDEYNPIAIFSFGQGGGYALETIANNRRGDGHDNSGRAAPSKLIVSDGPDQFTATIDAARLTKRLKERGHDVAISRAAGNYLCEECLYSLEYLKAQRKLDKTTVLFLHVPPLGERYKPADSERFIRDVLECWREIARGKAEES